MKVSKKIKKRPESSKQISIIDGTKAYIELRQNVIKQGILNRAYGYYTFISLLTFAGLFFSAYMIFITPISVQLIGWCLLLAFFTIQVGGLVHDSGHRAIAKSSQMNDFWGQLFGSIVTMGYSYWRMNHNKHHAHTNQEDEDPDMELPLHAFTKRQFLKEKGVWRLIQRYQAFFYYPLRTLSAYTQRLDSLKYFKQEKRIGIVWEVIVWSAGMFVWFFLPFLIFSLPKALLVFLFVHTATGFYMSNIFAPNHKGMPQLSKNIKISFLEHQIMTSRNIYGHWLTDYVFMGLNYQIEHHLFPNCPRNKLKLITPFVLEICRKMNLEYTQVSIIESNKIILATLQQTALSEEAGKS